MKIRSKSASSWSPAMAQSNLVSETRGASGGGSSSNGNGISSSNNNSNNNISSSNTNSNTAMKHAIEVAPMEQLAGSMCTEIAPNKKVGSLTKQQLLAANQQVIDADEQLLQQKLQSKQRKSSIQDGGGGSSNGGASNGAGNIATLANGASSNANAASNGVQKQQPPAGAGRGQTDAGQKSPSLCRICDSHVYQMERLLAEKAVYHKSCFRCHQCKTQLRIDNYASHAGQVYCKAHHRQIFQPQVMLDNEDDVDIVAKSTSKVVDDYLLHRGRLSDLSFSFLQPRPEGIRKRQMIICENEPAELPKDVVRSDTKVDDGIERMNLNLGNIKERFERGAAAGSESSPPSSAGIVIEKPSFNLKQTLLAFENQSVHPPRDDDDDDKDGVDGAGAKSRQSEKPERRVVKKLTNLNVFLNRQSSSESESGVAATATTPQAKPLAVRRSESLMMRLKKYESRIAGDQVANDDDDDDDVDEEEKEEQDDAGAGGKGRDGDHDDDVNNNKSGGSSKRKDKKETSVPKKLSSIDLSSLKSQWENGDISRRRSNRSDGISSGQRRALDGRDSGQGDDDEEDGGGGGSPSAVLEKNEELVRIRQQLARKRSGGGGASSSSSSIKNIYESAIREAEQSQKRAAAARISDLSALNGLSTVEIQQQLLQNGSKQRANSHTSTPSTPSADPNFQSLKLSNKANKLRERFEQGLINNESRDSDSDQEAGGGGGGRDGNEPPALTKLEQLRQEKMEDLSIFTEGEVRAREARNMFQQIDRRLSNGLNSNSNNTTASATKPRSLSSISASMQAKLQAKSRANGSLSNGLGSELGNGLGAGPATNGATNGVSNGTGLVNGNSMSNNHLAGGGEQTAQKPIRLMNNVRT